jgi:hypothetical protein
MSPSVARKVYHLSLERVRNLPTMLGIPGRYGKDEKKNTARSSVTRMSPAIVALIRKEEVHIRPGRGMSARLMPPSIPRPPRPPPPRLLRQYDDRWKLEQKYRFMPLLRIPFFDRQTGELLWGVSCQACRLGFEGPQWALQGCRSVNIVYSTAGYLEHFQTCKRSTIGRDWIAKQLESSGGDGDGDLAGRLLEFLENLKH